MYEEIADYTSDQFLAEIGGSAGLFLGLSLLSIMEFCANIFVAFFSKGIKSWKKTIRRTSKSEKIFEKCTSTSGKYRTYKQVIIKILFLRNSNLKQIHFDNFFGKQIQIEFFIKKKRVHFSFSFL